LGEFDGAKKVGVESTESENEGVGELVGKKLQVFAVKKLVDKRNVIFLIDETGKMFEFGIYKNKQ
jgi:hypothetical protein